MAHCSFYFGNDNGIRHAAVAAGIPTAAVFGPPNPVSWTPPGSDRDFYAGGQCAIDSVAVDDVDAMVGRLIATCGPSKWGQAPFVENCLGASIEQAGQSSR